MAKSKARLEWVVIPLSHVLEYFSKSFKVKDGSKIIHHDGYVDVGRRDVVYCLTVVQNHKKRRA